MYHYGSPCHNPYWGTMPSFGADPSFGYPTLPAFGAQPMTPYHPSHHYYPMIERTLEAYHPELYHHVHPVVLRTCDTMDDITRYPIPTRDMVAGMADVVIRECEGFIPIRDAEDRQLWTGRRVFIDLITILLISQLLRRRRRHFGFDWW